MQGAMWMQPLLPTLPVTFDAAEALRQAAQRAVPLEMEMEMTKTMFLLMILGPWRLADVLAMRPSAIILEGDASYCALQTKGGRGEYEWRVVEPCDNKIIHPVVQLKYLLSQQTTRDKDSLWINNNGSLSQAPKHLTWYNNTCCILALNQNDHHITAMWQMQAQWYLKVCHKWLWHDMEVGTAWRICCFSTSKHMQMMTCHAQLRSMSLTSS